MQKIFEANGEYGLLDSWFNDNDVKSVLLVCGNSIKKHKVYEYFKSLPERLAVKVTFFMDFKPNPLYEDVLLGVEAFHEHGCDTVVAVGGGSAMDVGKCIKLFATLPGSGGNGEWLGREYQDNDIHFLAMPTTSGTGSEATTFAVIYYDGAKCNVDHISAIPEAVLMDSSVLKTVPDYHKKATMLDALCHGVESFWSVNSTKESRDYAYRAISMISDNMEDYLNNTDEGNLAMLKAANLAGKAINISKTTAGHAMCYKITGLFGCAHGHAAALCDRVLYPWMIENVDKCSDKRGREYLADILDKIGIALGCSDAESGALRFNEIFDSLGLDIPGADSLQFDILKTSVNVDRLKNHPITLDEYQIDELYHKILNGD